MQTINSIEFNILKASSLGERIRFLRQKLQEEPTLKDYTVKEIAKRIDIPFQTLTSVERGDSQKPSIFLVNSIAKDFGVNIEVFLDDYYQGDEKLFSFGEKEEDRDVQTIELDEDLDVGDTIYIDELEYKVGSGDALNRRRNIHILINEEFHSGDQKNLYHHQLNMSENDLMTMLMNVIQQTELNPSSLSYNSWTKALKTAPLNTAFTITNKKKHELPDIHVEIEETE